MSGSSHTAAICNHTRVMWAEIDGCSCKALRTSPGLRAELLGTALKAAQGKQRPAASLGTLMLFTRGRGQEQPRGGRDGVPTGCSPRPQTGSGS